MSLCLDCALFLSPPQQRTQPREDKPLVEKVEPVSSGYRTQLEELRRAPCLLVAAIVVALTFVPLTYLLFLLLKVPEAVPRGKSNVLFLAADDMRVQLGALRVPGTAPMSTPNLDELIGRSLFLTRVRRL